MKGCSNPNEKQKEIDELDVATYMNDLKRYPELS